MTNVLQRTFSRALRDPNSKPLYLEARSSKGFILLTVCLAIFTDIFLYGIVVPVLPFALTVRAGVHPDDVQHQVSILLSIYAAALLVASPLCGWFADHSTSRRFPLILGLLALAGSTVMLCVGNSIAILMIGRALQGVSAAMVWTVGLALIVDTVGQDEIGENMGYISLSMSMGILLAPLLGGVVYDKAGYYQVYAMAFATLGLDVVLRLIMIEKKVARQWETEASRADVAKSGGQERDDARARALAEKNEDETSIQRETPKWKRKLPPVLTLLKSQRLIAALWGVIVQASLFTAFDSTLPLFVQSTFSWSSTGAGLIFLPLVLPTFVSPLIGRVCDRYGPRYLCAFGFILALPFLVLLRFVSYNSIRQIVLLCALLALIGFAIDLTMPALLAEITYVVDAKEKKYPGQWGSAGAYAQAYALFNMAWACGSLVGPLWAGYVRESAGWGTMSWSLGILSAFTAVPALLFTGGRLWKRR